LGIHDLEVKNTFLLGKWPFKLLTKDRVWQTFTKRKCIGSKALSQVCRMSDSHFLDRSDGDKEIFLPLLIV
jgi:hypothetical protein